MSPPGRPKGVVSLDQAVDKLRTARKAVDDALDRVEKLNDRFTRMKEKKGKLN